LQFGKANETSLQDVVGLEPANDELYFEGDVDTYAFRLAFDYLAEECLSPAESREMIWASSRQAWSVT
jgi:hypothetical protein